MSDKLGTRKYGMDSGPIFLGRKMTEQSIDYSDHIAKEIDSEINHLIDEAYEGATKILKKHKKALISISKILLDKEVIDGTEFLDLIKNGGKSSTKTTEKKDAPQKKVAPKKVAPTKKKPTKKNRAKMNQPMCQLI